MAAKHTFPSWLLTYPIEYLTCRAMGHSWDEHGSFLSKVARGLIGNHLTCLSCKGQRYDVYDVVNGLLWGRDYDMPDGYGLPDDEHWQPKAVYVAALHHRSRKNRKLVEPDARWESANDRAMRRFEDDDPLY